MPENKVTPAPVSKKTDVSATTPSTSPTNEQKSSEAQMPQASKTATPAEKKPGDPSKESRKISPALPTTPPPKTLLKEQMTKPMQAEDKGKFISEPKQVETPESPADDKKPAVEQKSGDKKPYAKDVAPAPKAEAYTKPQKQEEKKPPEQKPNVKELATDPISKTATEPKKPGDKAAPGNAAKGASTADPKKGEPAHPAEDGKSQPSADAKKPEDKTPATDLKGKPVDAPKKEDAKATITVSGKDKVDIPSEPNPVDKADTPKATDLKKQKPRVKAEPTVDPAQAAEGPKGIIITQVFDDRLAPPSEADLKNLPIPKEGEAFSMRLHPAYFFEFLEHPFTINRETKDYKDLYESIKENGIHDPVCVRPRENGGLEIMSGHRRHDIGAQLNYPIPTIIVHADDDTARIAVVDGNLHRMDIPTSELARAAKMKMEALTRKAGRRSKMEQLTTPQKRSDQQVAEDMGMSRNQVQRLVRIDSLVPELKQQVDEKKLPFNTAVELSYMKPEEQSKVFDFMAKEQVIPSMAQATELKEASKHAATLEKYTPLLASEHKVDEKKIESIIKPQKTPELKVTFTGAELKDYFPGKTPGIPEVKRVVFEALDLRKKTLEKQAKKQEIKNPAR